RGVADHRAVGVAVAEGGAGAATGDARFGVADIHQARLLGGLAAGVVGILAHAAPRRRFRQLPGRGTTKRASLPASATRLGASSASRRYAAAREKSVIAGAAHRRGARAPWARACPRALA